MKDKFKAFFQKNQNYYTPDNTTLTPEKELKKLRKENQTLKKEFFEQTLQNIKSRRSVRSFSSTPLDEKTLYDCIDAAINSPAAGNLQNFNVILVKNNQTKNDIGNMALNQCWISDAPVVAIVVRDDKRINEMYPQHGERYSLQNTAAFITTLLNLIHSSGYASCWVEACEEEVLKERLNIPKPKFIDAILPIGYPMEIPQGEKLPYEDIINFENFGNKKK